MHAKLCNPVIVRLTFIACSVSVDHGPFENIFLFGGVNFAPEALAAKHSHPVVAKASEGGYRGRKYDQTCVAAEIGFGPLKLESHFGERAYGERAIKFASGVAGQYTKHALTPDNAGMLAGFLR